MMAYAISTLIAGLVGFFGVMFIQLRAAKRENSILKTKGIESEAKKIVDSKSDDQLVDDFNKRYAKPGDGN